MFENGRRQNLNINSPAKFKPSTQAKKYKLFKSVKVSHNKLRIEVYIKLTPISLNFNIPSLHLKF